MNMRRLADFSVGHFRTYAAACACLAAILVAPIPAHAQCAAATAAAIEAAWTRDQTLAAWHAGVSRMYPGTDSPVFGAWRALNAAAEANASAATKVAADLQKAADASCAAEQKAIDDSHVEIRDVPSKTGGFVSMQYCSPITVELGSDCPAGNNKCPIELYGYPTWMESWEGIGESQPPVTILQNNCATGGQNVVAVLTPPPPDNKGACASGMFWSGSVVVGCLPCPPSGNAFGCPFIPPVVAKSDTKVPPTPVVTKKPPNVCNPPPTPPTPQVSHVDPGPRVAHVDPAPQVSRVDPEPAEPKAPTAHVKRQPRQRGGGTSSGIDGAAVAIGIIGELLSHTGSGSGGHPHGGGGHGGGNPCGGGHR
jgi:hypothetical protein